MRSRSKMGSKRSRTVMVRLSSLLVVASLLILPATQIRAQQSGDQFEQIGDPVMSAQALISDELQAGTIDFETSLVYRAYALFDDPRLPADLAGGGSFGEDYPLFGQIKYTWNQLSPETQQVLTPFVVRPADSRSIYFKSLADGPRTVPES